MIIFSVQSRFQIFIIINYKIKFRDLFAQSVPGQSCLVSIDGTNCPIQEPSPFSSEWTISE
jgi:hypothetical protein